jgi:hypothetical protein
MQSGVFWLLAGVGAVVVAAGISTMTADETAEKVARDEAAAVADEMLVVRAAAEAWRAMPGNAARFGEVPLSELPLAQAGGAGFAMREDWRVFHGQVALAAAGVGGAPQRGSVVAVVCDPSCTDRLAGRGVSTGDLVARALDGATQRVAGAAERSPGVGWVAAAGVDNPRVAGAATVPLPTELLAAVSQRVPVAASLAMDPATISVPYAPIAGGRLDVCTAVPVADCPHPSGVCRFHLPTSGDETGAAACPTPEPRCVDPAFPNGNGRRFDRTAIWADSEAAPGVLAWTYGPWIQRSTDCWRPETEVQVNACAWPWTGGTQTFHRSAQRWEDGRYQVTGGWGLVADGCWQDNTEGGTDVLYSCPAGETGSVTFNRVVRTFAAGGAQDLTGWYEVGRNCVASNPVCYQHVRITSDGDSFDECHCISNSFLTITPGVCGAGGANGGGNNGGGGSEGGGTTSYDASGDGHTDNTDGNGTAGSGHNDHGHNGGGAGTGGNEGAGGSSGDGADGGDGGGDGGSSGP